MTLTPRVRPARSCSGVTRPDHVQLRRAHLWAPTGMRSLIHAATGRQLNPNRQLVGQEAESGAGRQLWAAQSYLVELT